MRQGHGIWNKEFGKGDYVFCLRVDNLDEHVFVLFFIFTNDYSHQIVENN